MYKTIDTYASGTTQLYNFDPPKPFKPINAYEGAMLDFYAKKLGIDKK